jgi:hypothetical protein
MKNDENEKNHKLICLKFFIILFLFIAARTTTYTKSEKLMNSMIRKQRYV